MDVNAVMTMPVYGIRGEDIRYAIFSALRHKSHLLPDDSREIIQSMSVETLLGIVDVAALAAQGVIRRSRRMSDPIASEPES